MRPQDQTILIKK